MRERNMLSMAILMSFLSLNFLNAQNFPATCGGSIPDNQCGAPDYDTCSVSVSGVGMLDPSTLILDEVCIDITHTWAGDVQVTLVAPDGTSATLLDGVGGSGDDFTGTCLSDAATTPIGDGSAPFTGSFIPQTPLSTFGTVNADGDWELLVCDGAGGDFGTVNSFELTFAPPPSCPSPTGLTLAAITNESVDVTWTSGGSATAFTIEICPSGTAQGDVTCMSTSTGTNEGPVTLSGLMAETDYDVYLLEECSGEITDTLSDAFTTLENCPAPTGISVTNIMPTSADISWATSGAATSFTVEVCPSGTAQGDAMCIATSTGTIGGPVTVMGLMEGADFDAYVWEDCPLGTSDTVSTIFSTPLSDVDTVVTCGMTVNTTHCYENFDSRIYLYTASDGVSTLQLTFNAGGVENSFDEIVIYDGTDNTAPVLYSGYGNAGDLTGLVVTSTGPNIFMAPTPDGSVSCSQGSTCCTVEWDWDVQCLSCIPPTATIAEGPCDDVLGISIDVDITDLGDGPVTITNDGGAAPVSASMVDVYNVGPFAFGDTVTLTLEHRSDANCDVVIGPLFIPDFCQPANDSCGGALDYDTEFGMVGAAGTCPANVQTLDMAMYTDTGLDPSCDFGGDAVAWYTWTANVTGVSFTSGTGAPGMEILSGADCDNLTTVACFSNVDGEFDGLMVGTTYYIMVYDDVPGEGVIEWCLEALPDCDPAIAAGNVTQDCAAMEFSVEVDVDSLGSSTMVEITNDGGVASTTITDTGTYVIGPFMFGDTVNITLENDRDTLCDLEIGPFTEDIAICPPVCGGKFFDSGGPNGNYSSGESTSWMICPDNPGDMVELTFLSFEVEGNGLGGCYDALTIYDGMDATGAIMSPGVGNCFQSATDGTEAPGGVLGTPVTATNPSGCLFITFSSDGSVTGSGWEADIACVAPAAVCGSSSVSLAAGSAMGAMPNCQSGGWTYYGDGTDYFFAMEKYPVGGNSAYFNPVVDVNVDGSSTSVDDGTTQTNTSPRYWNVDLVSGVLNGFVTVRFYYDPAENTALEAASAAWAGSSGVDNGLEWFKTEGANFDPTTDVTATGVNTELILVPTGMGMENGVDYVEFQVTSFSGGGAKSSARNAPLPVELISFSGYADETSNILEWNVAQEINVKDYTIERSINGRGAWASIGTTPAIGTQYGNTNYQIEDNRPLAKAYYRLKSVDLDGSIQYSRMVVIERRSNEFKLNTAYPIPTKDILNLEFEIIKDSKVNVSITEVSGRTIFTESFDAPQGVIQHQLSIENLPSGIYILQLENEGERIIKRVVKE
ncbi:MAG: T9SS type A sorting domain-containing protein [Bacteroidota bacterium]